MKKPRVISNSELNAWQECQRKYYYGYDLKLELLDKSKGPAIRTGIIGHAALEVYFKHLQENEGDFENARLLALSSLAMTASEAKDLLTAECANTCIRVLAQYFDHFEDTRPNARVLGVESFQTIDLVDDFSYGMTADLILQDGPFVFCIDHKFTYNFWNQTKIDTKGAAQIVKYFFVLKRNGIPVDKVMLNEIRYRERKSAPYTREEMFREDRWTPTQDEQINLMGEQIRTSRQIIEHRKLPLEERSKNVLRSLGSAACEYCDFSQLCLAELRGEDIESDIEAYYKPREYDYNPGGADDRGQPDY